MKELINKQLGGVSNQVEMPPCFGGLNTRDSRAAMAPQDAIALQNIVSEPGGVKSRLGNTEFCTGVTGNVGFIKEFVNGVVLKMVVGAGATLYAVNSNGSATTLSSGYSNTDWMAAKLGSTMVMVNGAEIIQYDGSATSGSAGLYTGDISTPGANTMDGIHLHGSRLYMWQVDSGDFYYGSINSVQGAFAKFALSDVSQTGGNITMMQTITRDGGSGPDDYAVFILETGEVLVYQGTNPSSASTFALVGRYFIPPPINKRCSQRVGGDVAVLTQNDIISLSEVMQQSTEGGGLILNPSKLSGAIREDFATYGTNDGWELMLYGKKGYMFVNVPETQNSTYHQLVSVVSTKAPSRFTGWDAYTMGIFDNELYFGGNGAIYKADTGTSDNGSNIECRAQQAYTTLGIPNRKNVKSLTIRYLADADVSVGADIGYDYEDSTVETVVTTTTTGAEWDTAEWDDADWAGASQSRNTTYMAVGTGVAISVLVAFDIQGTQLTWLGTNVSFENLTMI